MTAPVVVRHPEDGARHALQSALEMLSGFVPWIVYWILVGNVPFRLAVTIAFTLALAITSLGLVRRRTPKVLEAGTSAVFGALVIITFTTNDVFLGRWIQPITNGGLLLVALSSIAVGQPFTLQYTRESASPEFSASRGFIFVNKVVTWVWVGAFAVMTASALVPPVLQGGATLTNRGAPASLLFYWVVPFTALGLAALLSRRFPESFGSAEPASPAPWTIPRTRVREKASGADRLHTDGAHLHLTPQVAPHDAPLHIAVGGAAPGAGVELTARAQDLGGRSWRAHARFHARADGTVDLASEAPVEGTYQRADPMGMLWSMHVEGMPDLFMPPTPLTVALEARVDGRGVLRATLQRVPVTEGVRVAEIREPDVTGRLFLPAARGPHPGVAVFGGFDGGLDGASLTASLLAARGHAALVVGTHGAEGLPEHLVEIPLERLAAGIRRLGAHEEVEAGRIAGMAMSRGAEGLLAAASLLPALGLRALVLVSPSSVTWQAIGEEGPLPGRSSWTLGGAPLPFHPVRGEALMPQLLRNAVLGERMRRAMKPAMLHLAAAYTLDKANAKRAAIPANRAGVPVLCLCGADDAFWPSASMTRAILERRRGARAAGYDEHRSYPGAGHMIRPPCLPTTAPGIGGIALGGSPEGQAAAEADAWPRVLAFLGRHLGAPPGG